MDRCAQLVDEQRRFAVPLACSPSCDPAAGPTTEPLRSPEARGETRRAPPSPSPWRLRLRHARLHRRRRSGLRTFPAGPDDRPRGAPRVRPAPVWRGPRRSPPGLVGPMRTRSSPPDCRSSQLNSSTATRRSSAPTTPPHSGLAATFGTRPGKPAERVENRRRSPPQAPIHAKRVMTGHPGAG